MTRNEQITAALLVAALVAAGCSKGDETPQTLAQSQHSAQTMPISDSLQPVPVADKGHDGANISGPVSFADGEAAYRAGDYIGATHLFERYSVQQPGNAWGHFMLGLSAWKTGDLVKAETAFDEALRIDPDHLKSLTNLSRILIEQGRFDDALVRLTQAGDIEPQSAEVYRLMGRTFAAQGQTGEAVDAYRTAMTLDDRDAWSMNNLGLLYIEQGRPVDAVPLLARAVELKNDVPTFHNNLGMALEHTGRFTAAAAEYSAALAADPAYEKAQRNLARVETVKVTSEEPFDLQAMARQVSEETTITQVEETAPEQ
jgi:Flp pilus assembly protein TadD